MAFKERIKQEILTVIPAIIYFMLTFNFVYFISGLIMAPGEPRYFTYLTATLSALVVGKVIVLVDFLPFINAFPNKPLIYNIFWKFFLYSFFVFIAKMLETILRLGYEYGSSAIILEHLQNEFISPVFWATFLMLLAIFFIFVVTSEFVQALGRKKVLDILLG